MSAAGDAERELLRQSVRDFLTGTSPEAQVRRLMATPDGIDAGVWKAMAGQLGLHGLAIPEQYGGSGYGWAELAVVFAELGRALVTVPYFATVALAATALLESDDEDARQRYLPAMASGDLYATVALPAHAQDTVRAAPDENGVVLHGRRSHVVDGGSAGLLVVLADGPDGPGVYLVDIAADSSGLTRTPLPTLDETRKQTDLLFDGCPARPLRTTDAAALVAAVEAAAAIALAGEQVGGAQRCLEFAVDYARTWMQFGRPIGSFQAVRHRTDEQRRRFLRSCFTAETVWCQLTSEPDAGSDVAGLSTMARRDDSGNWLLNGQKVWTSLAHIAEWGLAVVRTDPDAPKHAGITCFIVDMQAAGIDVRPLRLLNGKADFNEVFLDDVVVPDSLRVGEVGQGWQVARSNLEGERAAFGAQGSEPDPGDELLAWWIRHDIQDPVLTDDVMKAVIGSHTAIVMRNVLADGVLGLPREPRFDLGMPWREIPRSAEEYARRTRGR